jgi:hypothetical protein
MILIEAAELKRQKSVFNNDFEKRMAEFKEGAGTKKPRRTKFPQQQYACACPVMRTYRGDILSSTCKDCIENGTAIPNCPICKCQCQTGIFTEKNITTMGLEKLRKDELNARERVPDKDQRARENFSAILSRSVKQGFESLSKSNSSLDERNVLSAAAGHLSRQQMPSEEELHSLQQYCPLTTKLRGSGADVRQAFNADPRKKNRRFSQNNLVDMSACDSDGSDDGEQLDCKLPAKPSPKRKQVKKVESGADFNSRTVHRVTGIMLVGSPASQQAALGVLENLSSSSSNVSKTIVKSTVDRGSISEGMSQEVAKTLLRAEMLRHQQSNK